MDVEGLNIEELREELSGSKKHSVGWIIFAFLLIITVVFAVIYRRRKRFAQYQGKAEFRTKKRPQNSKGGKIFHESAHF